MIGVYNPVLNTDGAQFAVGPLETRMRKSKGKLTIHFHYFLCVLRKHLRAIATWEKVYRPRFVGNDSLITP
jgi:hypothetical protein